MAATVLIVDDDPEFRRVARELLADAGLTAVAEAVDGQGALAAVERFRPDAVLLDVHLPDSDGFALARALRDRARRPRVLLTSTDASLRGRELPEDCGAVAFVPKTDLARADLARYLGR